MGRRITRRFGRSAAATTAPRARSGSGEPPSGSRSATLSGHRCAGRSSRCTRRSAAFAPYPTRKPAWPRPGRAPPRSSAGRPPLAVPGHHLSEDQCATGWDGVEHPCGDRRADGFEDPSSGHGVRDREADIRGPAENAVGAAALVPIEAHPGDQLTVQVGRTELDPCDLEGCWVHDFVLLDGVFGRPLAATSSNSLAGWERFKTLRRPWRVLANCFCSGWPRACRNARLAQVFQHHPAAAAVPLGLAGRLCAAQSCSAQSPVRHPWPPPRRACRPPDDRLICLALQGGLT